MEREKVYGVGQTTRFAGDWEGPVTHRVELSQTTRFESTGHQKEVASGKILQSIVEPNEHRDPIGELYCQLAKGVFLFFAPLPKMTKLAFDSDNNEGRHSMSKSRPFCRYRRETTPKRGASGLAGKFISASKDSL